MGGIDQALQIFRSPVGAGGGKEGDAVVSPVPASGEIGHRHELDRAHPEPRDLRELAGERVEGAVRGVGSDVQLIERKILVG